MIKVLIAGNTRIYRDGLTKALGDHPDLQICGVAANETETEAALRSAKPDVLLVDILMSQALRIVRAVPAIDPEIKIVVLAIADEDAEILAWAEAGVSGFVTRENTLDQLAIPEQARGNRNYRRGYPDPARLTGKDPKAARREEADADRRHLNRPPGEEIAVVAEGREEGDATPTIGERVQ